MLLVDLLVSLLLMLWDGRQLPLIPLVLLPVLTRLLLSRLLPARMLLILLLLLWDGRQLPLILLRLLLLVRLLVGPALGLVAAAGKEVRHAARCVNPAAPES
jgi:hypothetical protein